MIPCVELLYEAFKHHRDVRANSDRSAYLKHLNYRGGGQNLPPTLLLSPSYFQTILRPCIIKREDACIFHIFVMEQALNLIHRIYLKCFKKGWHYKNFILGIFPCIQVFPSKFLSKQIFSNFPLLKVRFIISLGSFARTLFLAFFLVHLQNSMQFNPSGPRFQVKKG